VVDFDQISTNQNGDILVNQNGNVLTNQ